MRSSFVVIGTAVIVGIVIAFFTPLGDIVLKWTQTILSPPEQEQRTIGTADVVLHLARFVQTSLREDGMFIERYRCEGAECTEVPGIQTSPFGYAIRGLLSAADTTGDTSFIVSADKAVERILRLCKNDARVCERNFFALSDYWERTQDPRYLEAIRSASPLIVETARNAPIETSAQTHALEKVEILYKLSGDEKFRTLLANVANKALEKWPDDIQGTVAYEANGYAIKPNMALYAGGIFVPAFRVTGDTRYLDKATEFYRAARIEEHLPEFSWEGGFAVVLQALEGLIALSGADTVPPLDRQSFAASARVITGRIVGWQFDAPERRLFDGGNNLVTGVLDANELPGTNYKSMNLNGWFLSLLSNEIFANESFTLFDR